MDWGEWLERFVDVAVFYAPVSATSVFIAAVGVLVSLLVAPPAARRFGWGQLSTVVAALVMTAVLALTLGPGGASDPGGVRTCVRRAEQQVGSELDRLTTSDETALNLLLLVPLGIAVVVATRKVWLSVLVVLALPSAIELIQTQIPGRVCSGIDLVTNVAGGLIGVAVGALVTLPFRVRH